MMEKIASNSFKIYSSGHLVVKSGSVFSFSSSGNIKIEISGLDIIFEFFNSEDKKQRLEREIVSTTSLKLKLFNFNNLLGSGLTNPVEIGMLNNKKLYLMFVVVALDENSSKNLHYTFFQE